MIREISMKIKQLKTNNSQEAKLTSLFGGSLPPHFGGSFAPNKDLIRFPFIMLTHLHHDLLCFSCSNHHKNSLFCPKLKQSAVVQRSFVKGKFRNGGSSLTFENKDPPHKLSEHTLL